MYALTAADKASLLQTGTLSIHIEVACNQMAGSVEPRVRAALTHKVFAMFTAPGKAG